MDKLYSSPLHYPGGKRWLFPILADILPPFKEMVSPFFGGGSIELNFAARGKYISGFRRQGKRKKNTELLIFSDDIYDYILEFQPQQQQLII